MLRRVVQAIRAWEDFAPFEVRMSWVRAMTPLFVIATIVSLVIKAWGGVVIAGIGATFGILRWWQLKRSADGGSGSER